MGGLILNEFNIKEEGIRKKVFYHFSDSHLSVFDEYSSSEEIEQAKSQKEEWEKGRIYFAKDHNEPYLGYTDKSPEEYYNSFIDLSNGSDLAVLSGDILDYYSGANDRYVSKGLSKLKSPYLFVCGNHENSGIIDDSSPLSFLKKDINLVEFEDMQVIGLNNSERKISDDTLDTLSDLLSSEKKSLIVMHIPIITEYNREDGKGIDQYFVFNYEGCPDNNNKMVDLILENRSKIICLMTGHLHFSFVSEVAEGLFQYGASQGLLGNVNKYTIGK